MVTASEQTIIQHQIQEMVNRIVRKFDPERIMLFGSQARGDANKDSDVDLLVVMEVDGLKRDKQVEIRLELYDIDVAMDIIVVTPYEFINHQNIAGTIPRAAKLEGKEIYRRQVRKLLPKEILKDIK